MKSRDIPTKECPNCHAKHNACTGAALDGEQPIPCEGDFTACAYCGMALIFGPNNTYIYARREEWLEIEPELREAVEKGIGRQVIFNCGNPS